MDLFQRMASTQRINITVVVRNAILSWQSHIQADQAWAPHSLSLPNLWESTSHASEHGIFLSNPLILKLHYLLTFYSMQIWSDQGTSLLRQHTLLVRAKMLLK